MDIKTQILALKETERRRKVAMKMKKDGKTLEEIGHVLGVSRQRAAKIIEKASQQSGI